MYGYLILCFLEDFEVFHKIKKKTIHYKTSTPNAANREVCYIAGIFQKISG